MNRVLALALCFGVLGLAAAGSRASPAGLSPEEERRMTQLKERLCEFRGLNCAHVIALFADPRLKIYYPPAPQRQKSNPPQIEKERNPFFTTRFGLLTEESLERCRGFLQLHASAFDVAYRTYGVPPRVICGILRIETNFGIATRLSPHPVGAMPAINRLVTLYVRPLPREGRSQRFAKWQQFAVRELKELLAAATKFGWDPFEILGSLTGAIGLAQFEPSSLKFAIDGNGDGKIDLFDPDDAIPSVANYLVTHGWDDEPMHQQRAIYAYYGGNYAHDPNRFYMHAVLKYADAFDEYAKSHALERETASTPEPH
jgi:membrane-bound lytic murein transglycosylase B